MVSFLELVHLRLEILNDIPNYLKINVISVAPVNHVSFVEFKPMHYHDLVFDFKSWIAYSWGEACIFYFFVAQLGSFSTAWYENGEWHHFIRFLNKSLESEVGKVIVTQIFQLNSYFLHQNFVLFKFSNFKNLQKWLNEQPNTAFFFLLSSFINCSLEEDFLASFQQSEFKFWRGICNHQKRL